MRIIVCTAARQLEAEAMVIEILGRLAAAKAAAYTTGDWKAWSELSAQRVEQVAVVATVEMVDEMMRVLRLRGWREEDVIMLV